MCGEAGRKEARRMMVFEDALGLWSQGRITQEDAARMLGVSDRTFRRWVREHECDGMESMIDRRLGRKAHNAAPVDEVMALITDYRTKHDGWNVRHYHDHYRDRGGSRSYNWVRERLQDADLVPKRDLGGKHRVRREPAPMPGMVLHQDASTHEWVPGKVWDLVVTMDDATNELYSAFFCEQEGTESSLRGVREAIDAKGLFCELRTDRGSHYWRTAKAGGKVDEAHPTQFKRAMDRLGIHLEPAYSPEARGRSERMFLTLQGRLPQELAAAGITDMERANQWMRSHYLKRHNKWLTRKPRIEGETAFVLLVDPTMLDGTLCESHERMVQNDNCVSFNGLALQIPAQPHRPTYRKMRVTVKRDLVGGLSIWHGPRKLAEFHPDGTPRNATSGTENGQESAPRKAGGLKS